MSLPRETISQSDFGSFASPSHHDSNYCMSFFRGEKSLCRHNTRTKSRIEVRLLSERASSRARHRIEIIWSKAVPACVHKERRNHACLSCKIRSWAFLLSCCVASSFVDKGFDLRVETNLEKLCCEEEKFDSGWRTSTDYLYSMQLRRGQRNFVCFSGKSWSLCSLGVTFLIIFSFYCWKISFP